jgi:multiple sugar transport system substrate-binding protein/sorbitol/mannitol transport system substrate-binding protein
MSIKTKMLTTAVSFGLVAGMASAEEITIATVNNADMITMQELAPAWEEATGNSINWVVLEENVLRQRTTQDIATNRWFLRHHVHRCL